MCGLRAFKPFIDLLLRDDLLLELLVFSLEVSYLFESLSLPRQQLHLFLVAQNDQICPCTTISTYYLIARTAAADTAGCFIWVQYEHHVIALIFIGAAF